MTTFLDLWGICSSAMPKADAGAPLASDKALPPPADTRPRRSLSAAGVECTYDYTMGKRQVTFRQVGWIGHRDGALYAHRRRPEPA